MLTRLRCCLCVCVTIGSAVSLDAAPPRKIADVATLAELETELTERFAELEPILAEDQNFGDNTKRRRQVASMLAVAAQALADHEEDAKLKPFAPDLRDAAIMVARAETAKEAAEGLAAAKGALAESSPKTAAAEYDWAKLVKQRPIMEDTETRMQQLQRALRRPKDPAKESALAIAAALASLPTLVDTHEVKDPALLPEWNKLAERMVDELVATAAAIKKKDATEANAQFKAARATCVECHRQFKKEN